MPEISRFLGVVISMYFDEHNPPHFHVKYNEFRAVLSIRECNVLEGCSAGKSPRVRRREAELHQAELLSMWDSKVFHKVDPLV